MKIKYVLIFKIPASVDKELSTISPWDKDKHARVFAWCLRHQSFRRGRLYTPNIFSNISREYHVKEVDKAKGINSNINSEFYCSQYNYWRQRYRPAVQATVKKDNWRRRVSSASLSLKAPPVYKRRSQTHAFYTEQPDEEDERRHRA